MKILVTGGSGFIGSALINKWILSGFEIKVFDNGLRGQPRRLNNHKNIELIEGDVRDLSALKDAAKGCDAIAHLAYINGTEFFYEKPDLVLEIALKGIINTIEAAIHNSVPQFWLMSSGEVYQSPKIVPTNEEVSLIVPDPLNPRYSYGGGKIISELYAINFGRRYFDKVSIVRPHNVYGPDMGWEHVIPQFAVKMSEQYKFESNIDVPFKILGDGNQTRAFCYIDDFVNGADICFRKGKSLEIYHVGNDKEIKIIDLAKEVGNFYGKKLNIIPSKSPTGETLRRCPDISKAKFLGYEPNITLSEGLSKTLEWYKNNIMLQGTNKLNSDY